MRFRDNKRTVKVSKPPARRTTAAKPTRSVAKTAPARAPSRKVATTAKTVRKAPSRAATVKKTTPSRAPSRKVSTAKKPTAKRVSRGAVHVDPKAAKAWEEIKAMDWGGDRASPHEIAAWLSLSYKTIYGWKQVPDKYVDVFAKELGWSAKRVRPDL